MKREFVTGVSAAILAGGQSRRFGRDKSDVLLDGRTLVRHVFEAVQPVADEVMISLGAGSTRPDIPDLIPVRDTCRDCGPLAGIHACLKMAAQPWLLVVACDLPRIRTASLSLLVSQCTPSNQVIVSGARDGQVQPLCGCYHRSVLKELEEALFERQFSVMGFIDSIVRVKRIEVAAEELVNINRPEDLPGSG
jgi:molybdopterin-guanine dinucleotide biosynthesis protein A